MQVGFQEKPSIKKTVNLEFENCIFVVEQDSKRNSLLVAIRDYSAKEHKIAGAYLDIDQVDSLIYALQHMTGGCKNERVNQNVK